MMMMMMMLLLDDVDDLFDVPLLSDFPWKNLPQTNGRKAVTILGG